MSTWPWSAMELTMRRHCDGRSIAQALKAAEVALMSNNLAKLPAIIHHSRRTTSVIRQNIFFNIGIRVIFLALALPGLATLWMRCSPRWGVVADDSDICHRSTYFYFS